MSSEEDKDDHVLPMENTRAQGQPEAETNLVPGKR